MSEFVTTQITSVEQLLQYGVIRLRSWKGDYLHRPDSPQGVTTWNYPQDWQVSRGEGGRIMLRSWKGDYLHRPDSPQGVTTWSNGDWTLEIAAATVRLKSWKGDYLHRPDGPASLTTWGGGIGNEWHVEARVAAGQLVAGDLYNTLPLTGAGDLGFEHGTTFTQRFQSRISTVPTELAVRMGSNQSPYRARLVIAVNDDVRFSHDFFDLRQSQSDWTTTVPLYDFRGAVGAGDWVSFSITPDRDISISALKIVDPSCPSGQLAAFGPITSQFCMRGAVAPLEGTYAVEVVDPTIIRSTMGSSSGRSYGFRTPFTQTFTAVGSGIPRELGVLMGANQNRYDCTVAISIRGTKIFERLYTGCVQRKTDWTTVFPLDGLTTSVQRGDQVAFTVTPNREVSMAPLFFDEVGVAMSTVPGYGAARVQFFMKT